MSRTESRRRLNIITEVLVKYYSAELRFIKSQTTPADPFFQNLLEDIKQYAEDHQSEVTFSEAFAYEVWQAFHAYNRKHDAEIMLARNYRNEVRRHLLEYDDTYLYHAVEGVCYNRIRRVAVKL